MKKANGKRFTAAEQETLINSADANRTIENINACDACADDKDWMKEIITSSDRWNEYVYADTAVREMLIRCIAG